MTVLGATRDKGLTVSQAASPQASSCNNLSLKPLLAIFISPADSTQPDYQQL